MTKRIVCFIVSFSLIFALGESTFSAPVNKWQLLTPGWSYYQSGNIDQSINVFQSFIDKQKNATSANYATANYGLGLCYAHSKKKLFYKALQYMNKAIQLDPKGDSAKDAQDYIKNKLMSSDFDLTYGLNQTITCEKAIAVTMYYLGYNQMAEQYKNSKIKDSNGATADKWCAPYIALAIKLGSLKSVPLLRQNVTRLWVAKYILNLKGINKFSYYTNVCYNDTKDLSISDQMWVNTANAQNIMLGDNKGNFYPNKLITRNEFAGIIRRCIPDNFKITKINQIPASDIVTKQPKKVEVYFTNDSMDMIDSNEQFLKTHENSIDHVIFTYANMRISKNNEYSNWEGEKYKIADDGKYAMYLLGWPQKQEMIDLAKETANKKFKRFISVSEDYESWDSSANNEFSALESKILRNDQFRNQFEKNLMLMVDKLNMDGLNIDLELANGADIDYMTKLISELSIMLKSEQKQLMVSISSSMEPDDIGKTIAIDYKAVGKIADYVSVRLYGLYGPNDIVNGGNGGPLAPAWWDDYVLKCVTAAIPSEKVFMGLATYGFDYDLTDKKRENVKVVYTKDIWNVEKNAAQEGTFKQYYDNASNTSYIEYKDKSGHMHRIWFENNYSINTKINLINKYNIAGINEWSLGYESSDFWDLINKRIKLTK